MKSFPTLRKVIFFIFSIFLSLYIVDEVRANSFWFDFGEDILMQSKTAVTSPQADMSTIRFFSEDDYPNPTFEATEVRRIAPLLTFQLGNYRYIEIVPVGNVTMDSITVYSAASGTGRATTNTNVLMTAPPVPKTPDAVSQIVAIPISDSEIKITWKEPDDDYSFAGVEIVHGNEVVTVQKDIKEYTFINLEPNTKYDFKIRSFSDLSSKKSGEQAFFATTLRDPNDIPPQEIRNLQSFVYADRIRFTWDNPDDVDHHEVRIYRDGQQIATAVTPANSFTDYDLTEHTTYTFVFFTVTTDNRRSEGISITETTKGKPRGKVRGVSVNVDDSQADYSFIAHQEATSYNIYLDGVKIDSTIETSGMLSGLENGREYTFQVSAVNEWGESELSDPVKFVPEERTIPGKPKVRATGASSTITLHWTPVKFATSYRIYDENDVLMAETSDMSFVAAEGLEPGDSRIFFVSAVNELGESEKTKIEGRTSKVIDFSGVNLPFSISAMLVTTMNFLSMYLEWVLLILGVLFSPVLYGLVIRLITSMGEAREMHERKQYAGMTKKEWGVFAAEEIRRTNEYLEKRKSGGI